MTGSGSLPEQQPPNGDSKSPAAWYRDPRSVAVFRYWDGDAWTSFISNGQGDAEGLHGRGRGQPLIALGGVALAISPFFTWVNVVLLGGLNLFQLFNAGGHPSGWAWAVVIAGGAVALDTGILGNEARSRIIGVMVGLFVGALAAIVFVGLIRDVRHADGLASISYGPGIAFLGCAVMVIGGLLPQRKKPAESKLDPAFDGTAMSARHWEDLSDPLRDLERLRDLRDAGVLTEEEVGREKSRILGQSHEHEGGSTH